MVDTHRVLWCFIKGDSAAFPVAAPSNADIGDLKDLVLEKRKNGLLRGIYAKDMTLWEVGTERLAVDSELTSYS